MSDHQRKEFSGTDVLSLQYFLETIEQETLPALIADRQFLKKQSSENIQHNVPYVSFQLAGAKMIVPLELVAEVGHLPVVTYLPYLPKWISGIVQLQGEILPVINVIELFQIDRGRLSGISKSFLLYSWHGFKMCLEVEKISGVLNFDLQHEELVPLVQKEKELFGELAVNLHGTVKIENERLYLLNLTGVTSSPLLKSWKEEKQL